MTEGIPESRAASQDWPVFPLQYTFNPDDLAPGETFEPDEVVIYDAQNWRESRWIAAKRGSYVSVEDIR